MGTFWSIMAWGAGFVVLAAAIVWLVVIIGLREFLAGYEKSEQAEDEQVE